MNRFEFRRETRPGRRPRLLVAVSMRVFRLQVFGHLVLSVYPLLEDHLDVFSLALLFLPFLPIRRGCGRGCRRG